MRLTKKICIGIFLMLALAWPVHAANVLYYADDFVGTDYVLPALNAGGHTVTQATDWTDFDNNLAGGGFDLSVALVQMSGAYPDLTTLTNFINSGGSVIFTDWTRTASYGSLFGATYTGSNNQTPATITDPDLASGITNPIVLSNPGWGIWSMGMTTTGTGASSGTFPNGDSCLVSDNGGRTLLLGFLADTLPAADGQQFFENAIAAVLQEELESIPTINEWGMIIFSLLMAGSAILIIRRRKADRK
jgi:hypothetical protein